MEAKHRRLILSDAARRTYTVAFKHKNGRDPASDAELAAWVGKLTSAPAPKPAPSEKDEEARIVAIIVKGANDHRAHGIRHPAASSNPLVNAMVAGGNARRGEDDGR